MTSYFSQEASSCAKLIKDGKLEPRELVDSCLARISEREREVGAWNIIDEADIDTQLNQLEKCAKFDQGPLYGLPVGIKDMFDTVGLKTAYGSSIYSGYQPPSDAACVARLRSAGAIVLGKTVTTEFAYWGAGKTRNPLDKTRTPGGSSSGSAAAVADLMVPLAIGTQTSGSVIRPASYCGVVGFKPSKGRISTAGVKALASSLDTVGVIARSVRDAALIAGVMAGQPDWIARCHTDCAPPKIGVIRTAEWNCVSPHGVASVDDAINLLEEAGASCDASAPSSLFEGLSQAQDTIMVVEAVRDLAYEWIARRENLSPVLKEFLERGISTSDEAYAEACRRRDQARAGIEEIFGHASVLVTPSTLDEAPRFEEGIGDPLMNRAWTLLGVPSITLPFGKGPLGLPLGLQFLARPGADSDLLAAADWISKHLLISPR